MQHPEIVYLPCGELIPYSKNAKKHDKKQIDNVAESIRQFGFVQPVVVDKDNVIVIGHCRVLAAKKLGLAEVPCVRVDGLTSEQVEALRIIDNKSNEAPWDMELLEESIASISFDGFSFDWGLNDIETIDWDKVQEISGDNYEKPETDKLRCPLCGGIDEKIRFKKI